MLKPVRKNKKNEKRACDNRGSSVLLSLRHPRPKKKMIWSKKLKPQPDEKSCHVRLGTPRRESCKKKNDPDFSFSDDFGLRSPRHSEKKFRRKVLPQNCIPYPRGESPCIPAIPTTHYPVHVKGDLPPPPPYYLFAWVF